MVIIHQPFLQSPKSTTQELGKNNSFFTVKHLIHAFLVRKRMAVLHNHYVDFLEIDIDSFFVPF